MKAIFCITGLAIQGLTISAQAQTGKPNIVVIMTDQQRADLCGREGFPLEVAFAGPAASPAKTLPF